MLQVEVVDMKCFDHFYKKLVNGVPGLIDVTSNFAMERIVHHRIADSEKCKAD